MPLNTLQDRDPLKSLEDTSLPVRQVRNKDWARDAFFVPRRTTNATASGRKSYNSSVHKFYDTTVGGNRAINPVPGFTPTADPRPDRVIGESNSMWLKGQGSYYSEAIDDNQETVSFQFGVEEYNALSTFFSNYYDASVSKMVQSGGMISDTMFTAGRVVGTLLTLPFQALFGLNSLYNRLSSVLTGTPYSKFYYMNPTMPLYLNTAQNLITALATNMFMAPSLKTEQIGDTDSDKSRFNSNKGNSDDLRVMSEILPHIYDEDGGINIFSIVGQAQRKANAYNEYLALATDTGSPDAVRKAIKELNEGSVAVEKAPYSNFTEYLASYRTKHPSAKSVTADNTKPDTVTAGETNPEGNAVPITTPSKVRSDGPGFKEYFDSERKGGTAFVTFRTNRQDGGTDTFSNGTKPAPLAETLNGLSSRAREATFTLAGGKLAGGAFGDIVDGVVNGIVGFVSGVSDAAGFTPASALLSGAEIEIPDMYDSSTVDFGSNTYNMTLHSPYGDKVSIFMNIYVPLCLLLAGALPRSTGKASHKSPFLCRAYVAGKTDIKLGMIESLTITKFTGNIGKSIDNLPTRLDVSLTVKNMDSIVTVPVTDSLFGKAIGFSAFDEDSALTDYLSAMSGLSLYDSYYLSSRLDLAWNKTVAEWSTLTSAASLANYVGGTLPGRVISALSAPGGVI